MSNVADDTIVISIRSRLAKTGKSTVARIIAEALGKIGLSVGVEDQDRRSPCSHTEDLVRHTDAIGVLVYRKQSLLIRVDDGDPDARVAKLRADVATEKHLANECARLVQDRDATIADLRELLEFKRKEIVDLRSGIATENELHDILYRLGRAAADARGVRFNGSIMGEDGVEQDITECIAAKVRERKASTLPK